MSVSMQIKSGDTRPWVFSLNQADGSDLSLSGATVVFSMKKKEEDTTSYFDRDTSADNSDLIEISGAATDEVTVRPTSSDWNEVSDFGIFVGEFSVTSSAGLIQKTEDIEIDIQENIAG